MTTFGAQNVSILLTLQYFLKPKAVPDCAGISEGLALFCSFFPIKQYFPEKSFFLTASYCLTAQTKFYEKKFTAFSWSTPMRRFIWPKNGIRKNIGR
jgi:hypothetical protein